MYAAEDFELFVALWLRVSVTFCKIADKLDLFAAYRWRTLVNLCRFLMTLCYLLQTADEYRLEYDSRRGSEYSRFHGYTYDGVWAVALAIQHVARHIRHVRENQTVADFRYRDPTWEDLFLRALRNTSFEGVTVR